MTAESGKNESALIKGIGAPPRGLALLMVLGPGLVWCGEYIGSGEVVLATRTGAIVGVLVLWALSAWVLLRGGLLTISRG